MNEFQPINIADGEVEIIDIKQTKKVKSKLFIKKVKLIIKDKEKMYLLIKYFVKIYWQICWQTQN